jgi:LysM repeat protein
VPAAPLPGADCIHEVSAGENLYRISLRYGVTMDAIAAASSPQILNPNILSIGQRLTIPGCGTTGAVPPATSTPISGTNGNVFIPPTATFFTTTGGSSAVAGTTYVVKQGDTLFAISMQTGVLVQSIADANGIQNINLILMGQTLVIPNQ